MLLFSMSQRELFEAFVRTRFAEEQNLGQPDIKGFLLEQRCATSPDETVWKPFLQRQDLDDAMGGDCLDTLRRNAEATTVFPYVDRVSNPSHPLWGVVDALLPMLERERVRLYRGRRCVVLDNNTEAPVVFIIYDDEPNSCHARDFIVASDVGEILLSTWIDNGKRAPSARAFLCNTLLCWVGRNRRKAKEDFDRAVAVSEDGTKIVHATDVVVFDNDGHHHHYASESFFAQKILRLDSMVRRNLSDHENSFVQRYVEACYRRPFELQSLIVSEKLGKSFLVTHKNFCPDPLPAPLPEPAKA